MRKLPKPPKPRSLPTKHRKPVKKSAPSSSGSNILAHEYDPETNHLTVTFAGGRQYRYSGVSQEIASGLNKADSKGRYLHASVIGKFPATKI